MSQRAPERVPTLKRRDDFKRLAKAMRRSTQSFVVQVGPAGEATGRFGLTITRKVGTATERNRIRRRLRAIIATLPRCETGEVDTVIVARRPCLSQNFAALSADLDAQISSARQKIINKAR